MGGGTLTELRYAALVILPHEPSAQVVAEYEGGRHPCARLLRPQWVSESMAAGRLLDLERYEVAGDERARIQAGTGCMSA